MTLPVLDVVCLCAAWCGTCGAYAETFAELQAALPGHRYRWIDIEDEADLVDDIDVETFPTLVLAHEGRLLFAGPVLPRLLDAQRLVAAQARAAQALQGGGTWASSLAPDQQSAYARLVHRLKS